MNRPTRTTDASAGRRPLAALLALCLLVLCSVAPGRALAQSAPGETPATVRAVPQFGEVEQGGKLVIAVELKLRPKYHAWPAKEVPLAPAVDEFAIRTYLGPARDDQDKPKLPAWVAAYAGTQYPKAKVDKVPDPTGAKPTIEAPLYSGAAIAFVRFEIAKSAPLGKQTIELVASYQACDEQACYPPEEIALPVIVNVVAPGAASTAKPTEPPLFQSFDAAMWPKPADTKPADPKPTEAKPADTKPTEAKPADKKSQGTPSGSEFTSPLIPLKPANLGAASFFGWGLGDGVLILGVFAVLGGFLLNLTPCVLPVIPIKVMTLTQHAGSHGRSALALGLWMALGVVSFWAVIGMPMAFISNAFDPSRFIFGFWFVTLGVGLVVALMGLGIMGLFNINLPQSVYMVDAKANTPVGSFLFGVLTGVLGLPCFGFVAGGLLAGVSVLPPSTIMVIFIGLGVGMAAPYLVLAVKPGLLRFIPRTGPASELVKQVMGLLLLAAAAFFIAAGIKALISDRPYLTGTIGWWVVAFFIAIAALWMIIRTFQVTKALWARAFMPLLGLIMVGGIVVPVSIWSTKDQASFMTRQAALAQTAGAASSLPTGVWLDYTPELFAAARGAGKSVLLDFTADWCINCKVLKRALLDPDPVRSTLESSEIVLLEVDCTSRNASGWAKLRDLNRTGIPTWVVYGPEASSGPLVIDLTTPTAKNVLDALGKAGVRKLMPKTKTASR